MVMTTLLRKVLSEKYSDGMDDISKHEKEKSLIIIDSLKEYLVNSQIWMSIMLKRKQ
jgi:hypothetical protein